MENRRFDGIDSLKGVLIISVITGHLLLGELSDTPARYLIYSLHMPLFLAVSGFLLKEQTFVPTRLPNLLKRYLQRLILPYLIAVTVYYLLFSYGDLTGLGLLRRIVFPTYHLWYIPVLCLCLGVLWFLKRRRISNGLLLALMLVIMIPFAILKESTFLNGYPRLALDTYKPFYWFFFFLGYYIRNTSLHPKLLVNIKYIGLLAFALLLFRVVYFYLINDPFLSPDWCLLNITLILLSLLACTMYKLPRCRLLEWIGTNSLPIYLYHVAAIWIAREFLDSGSSAMYYLIAPLLLALEVAAIYFLSRIPTFNRLVFGRQPIDK